MDDRHVTLSGGERVFPNGADAGLQIGLPASFRLFGADVTVPFTARQSVLGHYPSRFVPSWVPSTGLQVRF